MKKKQILIPIIVIAVLVVAAAAIIIVHRYNTPKVVIGISRSFDGKVNYPVCSSSATSNFGLSSSGQKKEQELMKYFRDGVGNKMVELLQEYDDLSLNTTIEYKGKKTIVHVFGQGIPKSGEAGLMQIDQIYELICNDLLSSPNCKKSPQTFLNCF